MKRLSISFTAAILAATSLLPLASHAAPAHPHRVMSVRVVAPKHALVITGNHIVTFHVHVSGIRLDPRRMGKRNAAGYGHIQVYLDRIPADAYKKLDLKGIVVAVGASSFTWQTSKLWTKQNHGHHTLIFALARNDDVLYQVKTGHVAITVK